MGKILAAVAILVATATLVVLEQMRSRAMATGEPDVAGLTGQELGSTSTDNARRRSDAPIPGVPPGVI